MFLCPRPQHKLDSKSVVCIFMKYCTKKKKIQIMKWRKYLLFHEFFELHTKHLLFFNLLVVIFLLYLVMIQMFQLNIHLFECLQASRSTKLVGDNHVPMVVHNFHEIPTIKDVMDFVHILIPPTYVLPLWKWHALQLFGYWGLK